MVRGFSKDPQIYGYINKLQSGFLLFYFIHWNGHIYHAIYYVFYVDDRLEKLNIKKLYIYECIEKSQYYMYMK